MKNKLKGKGPFSINFWRTKDGAEVDFVLRKGKKIIGIECKFSDFKVPKYTRSMRSFVEKYKPASFFVLNKSFKSEVLIGKTKIIFLPYYEIDKIVSGV